MVYFIGIIAVSISFLSALTPSKTLNSKSYILNSQATTMITNLEIIM